MSISISIMCEVERILGPAGSDSLGNIVLSRVGIDSEITEALSLGGQERPTWPRIYDIIEFLGGPESISESGFASKREIVRVRQTANHYRHLGAPRKNSLPKNPPTLLEASQFATEILKRWIFSRL
jgi:hypothetical protein